MNLRKIIILAAMIFIPISTIALTNQTETLEVDGWQPAVEGVDGVEYQKFRLTNPVPVNVFVARMEIGNPNVIIESSIARGKLSGGVETVTGMADRYNQALNNWPLDTTLPLTQTWGSRNNVIVAINGYYWDYSTSIPQRGQVQSGWYAKRFDDNQNGSGFIWKMDRSAFMGGCITHPANKQYVYDVDSKIQIEIDGNNINRGDDELILYTSQYDRDTNTDNSGTEVVIEMYSPSYTSIFANMPYGIVRKVQQNKGSSPIPYDHIVLSGHGVKAKDLITYLQEDDIVRIGQRVVDCTEEPVKNDWDLSYSGVGGHWRFLRGGDIYFYDDDPQAKVREPRTAIAYNDSHIFFIVADGRDPGVSEGMTVAEMAEFAKNILKATDGIMQDGGGSSTMVVNGEIVNNTFCNNVFCAGKVFIPLVINTPDANSSSQSSKQESNIQWVKEAHALQRLVANGMMMVVVEPMARSTQSYVAEDPISTNGSISVFLGPGSNYAILDTTSGEGTISDSLNQLGGIFAKGSYWWKVKVGSVEGWVTETDFYRIQKSQSSTEFKPR